MKLFNNYVPTLPRVDGKVFVITGTTSGTGNTAARTIAKLGGEVVMLNRKSSRSANTLETLRKDFPKATFVPVECDLQSFASVRKAADEVKAKYDEVYCLACNAGIMATPDKATMDGYDTQMQTNHLSHFLLVEELKPLVEQGSKKWGEARIVTHSSLVRNNCNTPDKGLDAKYFGKNGGNLGGDELRLFAGPCFDRYSQSKLANSVHMHGLHNQFKQSGSKVKAISCHPGLSDTGLDSGLKFGFFSDIAFKLLNRFCAQSPQDGTLGLLKAMLDPESKSGVLYGPKNSRMSGPAVPNPPKKYETDPAAIEMLFRTSAEAAAPFRSS